MRHQQFFRRLLVFAGLIPLLPLTAQDRFPQTIPQSNIVARFETVATVPDSSPGQPPRISVVTQDPSGRLFANDQRGPLYWIHPESASATEYLDLRDFAELDIVSTSEAGFQSFAFHPDFFKAGSPGYGRLYTIHSCGNTATAPDFDPGGGAAFHTLLLEWRTNDPNAAAFSAANAQTPYREILRLKQPFGNHNAGLIAFNTTAMSQDSDYGNLYVAVGDGGAGGDPQENGQDPSNPYGAILRIDPLGTDGRNGKFGIVSENALAADGDPDTIPEIYCYGLRNPQRFSWDSATGIGYIADIGQNAVEEINRMANGANFGWDTREGSFPFESNETQGLVDPIAEYDHTDPVANASSFITSRAVTVGEVARGIGHAALEGRLFLGDFPAGFIFLLYVDNDPLDSGQDGLVELLLRDENGQDVRFLDLINASRANRGLSASSRADLRFSVGTPGVIYLSNKHDGIIRRIAQEARPTLSLQTVANGGLTVAFTGSLQTSSDLLNWTTLQSADTEATLFIPASGSVFIRSI